MTIKYTITDVVGQEATIKFSEVTVITKTNFSGSDDSHENCYNIEVVYLNSRRTRLVCHIEEYKKLMKAYGEYEAWLEENPTFEKSRLDLSMLDKILKNTIVSSTESVFSINQEIQNGLVDMHQKMADNTVESDRNFATKVEKQLDSMKEQMASMQQVMLSVTKAVDAINRFVPQNAEEYKTQIEKDIEYMNEEVKES